MTTPTPAYIGRYILKRPIASGGFATVAEAWDEDLEAPVAIKILDDAIARQNDDVRARFIEEARLLRRINSGSVVSVHDVGRLPDGRPYFVMDYADQGTLTDIVARSLVDDPGGALRPDILSALVDALADGLGAIHRAGVVHRDLKPDNILFQSAGPSAPAQPDPGTVAPDDVTRAAPVQNVMSPAAHARRPRILLADFGIAKDLAKRGSMATLVGGTPAYHAPEQLNPGAEITPAVDIYAAGAVLWFALQHYAPPVTERIPLHLDDLPEAWRPVLQRAMAPEPGARFADIEHLRAAALEAIAQSAAATPARAGAVPGEARPDCPYLGLNAFQPEDSARFFGRERLVETLMDRLRSASVLVIGGASGSGKSSILRAGLVAGLRDGRLPGSADWKIHLFTPGRDVPAEFYFRLRGEGQPAVTFDEFSDRPALSRLLIGDSRQPNIIVVDQFEEIFTLNDEKARKAFIESLAALTDPAESPHKVVLSMRADFYGHCAALPWLSDAITRNQVLVGPMSTAELRRAITEPGRSAGIFLERNLIDAIMDDAAGEVGALPLISHALVETWARGSGSVLTLESYRSAGGVVGALRQTADTVFDDQLNEAEQAVAKKLMLSLVSPGEGTSDSRRIVRLDELADEGDAALRARVVQRLTDARLLTVDGTTVQITHEALLRAWPRLTEWIEDARNDLRIRQRIANAAREWEAVDRDEDLLLRGGRLAFISEWFEGNRALVGPSESAFVRESIAAKARADDIEAMRQKRNWRIRAAAISALSFLAIGATVASVLAINESRRAVRSELRAETATMVANERFASALGAAALGMAETDPLLALRLSVEAMGRAQSPGGTLLAREAIASARMRLASSAPVPYGRPIEAAEAHRVAIDPAGRLAAVGHRTGQVTLFDTSTRMQIGAPLQTGRGGVEGIAFDPGGTSVVVADNGGGLSLIDVSDGIPTAPRRMGDVGDVLWDLAFHPDGQQVVTAGEDGAVRVWDLHQKSNRVLARREDGDIISVAVSPKGDHVLAGTGEGVVLGWRIRDGAPIFDPAFSLHTSDVWRIVFDSSGELIATSSSDGTSKIAELPTTNVLGRAFAPEAMIGMIAATSDGIVWGGDTEGRVRRWNLTDAASLDASGPGHAGTITDIATDRVGRVAATIGADQLLRVWRTDLNRPLSRLMDIGDGPLRGVLLRDDRVVASGISGKIHVADPHNGALTLSGHGHEVWALDADVLSGTLYSGDRGGWVRIHNLGTGAEGGAFRASETAIWTLKALPENRLMVASDEAVRIWDIATQTVLREILPAQGQVTRAALSTDAARIALASSAGMVEVHDLDGDEPPSVLRFDDDLVWTVAFDASGTRLLAGTSDEIVAVWDLTQNTRIATLTGHFGGATDAAFLGDGTTLAAADRRGALHLWDIATGRRIAKIADAHRGPIWRLSVDPGSSIFATAGDDGLTRVWDLLDTQTACALSDGVLDDRLREVYFGDVEANGITMEAGACHQ